MASSSWVRGKCIGKGAFATVSVAVRKFDGRVFAAKSVDRKTGLPGQLEALENEIRILRRMSSPFVVAFLGDDSKCEGAAATPYRNLHLEYLPGGTIADLGDDVDERVVRHYTWCLVSALRHVHSNGVVHCDVKGRNVLVGPNGCIAKLADFGSAVEFSGEGCSAVGMISPRGSPLWMAPEVIRREYQGPESDVWSLGCTVIEMVTGKPAWEDHSIDTLSRIGCSGDLPEFPSQLSELGCDFLEKCLRREPSRRWNCDQLLQHPFLLSSSITDKLMVMKSSPRCVLDWVNSEFAEEEGEEKEIKVDAQNSARGRIGKLATSLRASWEIEGWVTVRASASDTEPTSTVAGDGGCRDEEEGTCWEYVDFMRVEEGMEVGTSLEYSGSGRGVDPEIQNLNSRRRLTQRRCDDTERECNGNRNRCANWSRGYGHGWGKVDIIKGKTMICSLCCNRILKSHYLFSIYVNIYIMFLRCLFCTLLFALFDSKWEKIFFQIF